MLCIPCLKLSIVWMCVCGHSTVSLAQSTPPSSQGANTNAVAATIQAILDIKPGESDYLKELEQVLRMPGKDLAGSSEKVDNLVNALLRGMNPGKFSSILVEQASLKEIKQDAKYGTFGDRLQLAKLLWQRAKAVDEKEPERSKHYARAALLLAAYEDFIFGRIMLSVVYSDAVAFDRLAGLSPEQSKSLSNLLVPVINDGTRGNAFLKYSYVEADLIEAPKQQISPDKLNEAITILDTEFSSVTMIGEQYQTITDAWMLRNLAYSRNDKQAQKRVDEMLNRWLNKASNSSVRRWLTEALTSIGEPFSHSRIIGPAAKNTMK